MDGDSPNNTAIEEDVPITHKLDTDMIATETSELGELNDEDNFVLHGALHHVEQVQLSLGITIMNLAFHLYRAQLFGRCYNISTTTLRSRRSFRSVTNWIMI